MSTCPKNPLALKRTKPPFIFRSQQKFSCHMYISSTCVRFIYTLLKFESKELHFYVICGQPFIKHFALCYHTVVCLSVMVVYCDQTVGWIKMKLGMQVGLGHILLDGDPAPLPKGVQPPPFLAHMLWPNGWMDYDATWYGGRPRPR